MTDHPTAERQRWPMTSECQHDPFQDRPTVVMESHPWNGRRLRCTACEYTAQVSKHGRIKPNPPPREVDPRKREKPLKVEVNYCPWCGAKYA